MQPAPRPIQGFHDLGPTDQPRFSRALDALSTTFARADYAPIGVPIIEHLDLYLQKYGAQVLPQIYSFVDQAKREVALRPEFTPSVIRAVAGRTADGGTVRASYSGPVFRYEPPHYAVGRQFTQAGIELLGDSAPYADADVVALACDAARTAGLPHVQLVLGHLGPVRELLRSLDVDSYAEQYLLEHLEYFNRGTAQREAVRQRLGLTVTPNALEEADVAISSSLGDAVREADPEVAHKQVGAMLEQMGLDLQGSTRSPDEIIERVIARARRRSLSRDGGWKARLERALAFVEALGSLRGAPDATLREADTLLVQFGAARDGLDELRHVVELLRDYDLDGIEVILAPGMARGIAYYSGLIFELFAQPDPLRGEQSAPICGGGRYDGLVQTLTGHAIPALGFAFDVERLVEALPHRALTTPHMPRLAIGATSSALRAIAQRTAASLRAQGIICRVHGGEVERNAALAWARSEGFDGMILVDRDPQEGVGSPCVVLLQEHGREALAALIQQLTGLSAEMQAPTAAMGGER